MNCYHKLIRRINEIGISYVHTVEDGCSPIDWYSEWITISPQVSSLSCLEGVFLSYYSEYQSIGEREHRR